MAELLKNMFDRDFIQQLSQALKKATAKFDAKGFEKAVLNEEWENMELKARVNQIALKLGEFLPYPYSQQIELIATIAPNFRGFRGTIFPTFVEIYGLENPAVSLDALEIFTPYSTGEFAIRPFLQRYPETIERLYAWSNHKNHHVRRLASEGCRPLLPWAMKLHQYVKDPNPILPILERLRNDPEDYVYRSVANNLNDISKHHPDLVLDLCEKWVNESQTTRWVCKHALRTLLKKGNPRAMQLFGFGAIDSIEIIDFTMAASSVKIGEASHATIQVKNTGEPAKFRLEYTIGYLKKNQQHNEKVFQLRETELPKNGELNFTKKLDFKDLTTRKHYPGAHYIALKINGIHVNKQFFTLE